MRIPRSDSVGFLRILKEHSKASKKKFTLLEGEYECMYILEQPSTAAVVWFDSDKTRFIGAGSGTEEYELARRKLSNGYSERHENKPKLAPKIAVDYNEKMGG